VDLAGERDERRDVRHGTPDTRGTGGLGFLDEGHDSVALSLLVGVGGVQIDLLLSLFPLLVGIVFPFPMSCTITPT
jgi:hypothetical protein